MEISKLKDFLIKAKRATYANVGAKKVSSLCPGSKDYEFSDGEMTYHDTYFGGTQFIGEEIVYENSSGKPIWGMNYYGATLDAGLSEEAMDKTLRSALMKVGEDDALPVRGPKHFVEDGYYYHFRFRGDLDRFSGVEEIFKDGKLIYQLRCIGGMII